MDNSRWSIWSCQLCQSLRINVLSFAIVSISMLGAHNDESASALIHRTASTHCLKRIYACSLCPRHHTTVIFVFAFTSNDVHHLLRSMYKYSEHPIRNEVGESHNKLYNISDVWFPLRFWQRVGTLWRSTHHRPPEQIFSMPKKRATIGTKTEYQLSIDSIDCYTEIVTYIV